MSLKPCVGGFFVGVVVLLLIAVPSGADLLPGNFLPNPSFELDDDGDGIPDGWLKGGNNPAGDLWEMDAPVTGQYHLTLLDEGDSSYTSWYTNVEIPDDAEELAFQWSWNYLFTSDNASDQFRMTVAWRSEGSDIGFNHVVVSEDQSDYVTERVDWIVPPDADAIRLEFVTGGPQTETGVMQIDDVSIAIPGQTLLGDFDANGLLDAKDVDSLAAAIKAGNHPAEFDVTGDLLVTSEDHIVWVKDLKRTWYGDANLDGEFNSADLVGVFQAGLYEDAVDGNSTWNNGDWNGDADFNSTDLVAAFQDGGYEGGPVAQAVPEPSAILLLIGGLIGCTLRGSVTRLR